MAEPWLSTRVAAQLALTPTGLTYTIGTLLTNLSFYTDRFCRPNSADAAWLFRFARESFRSPALHTSLADALMEMSPVGLGPPAAGSP